MIGHCTAVAAFPQINQEVVESKFHELVVAEAGVVADLGAVAELAGAGVAATINIAVAVAAEVVAEVAGAVVLGEVFAQLAVALATFSAPSIEPEPFAWFVWVAVELGAFEPAVEAKLAVESPGGSGKLNGSF